MAREAQRRGYAAFISYRHLPLDRKWAQWLLDSLERFRTPRSLVRKGFPARIAPVYRDEDEVPASANLSRHIEEALEASRALIVICTPDTPSSRWIDREVRQFQESGRSERIHVLLAGGEPETSFPRALLDDEDSEPIAADVRPRADASDRKLRHMARLRLAAALLGCTFDDLRRRERQRTRRRIAAAATLGLLLLGLGGWLGVDYLRRRENVRMAEGMAAIERELIESHQSDERLRAALAFNLLADRNWANARIPSAVTRALLPVSRLGAVRHVPLGAAPTRLLPRPNHLLVGTETGALYSISDSGIISARRESGCPIVNQAYGCAVTAIAERGAERWAIGIVGGMVALGGSRGNAQWLRVSQQRIDQLVRLDGDTLLAVDGSGRLYWIFANGSVREAADAGGPVTAALNEGGTILLVRARGIVERLRPDGRRTTIGSFTPLLAAAAFVRGRLVILREPPPSPPGEYRAPGDFRTTLIRREGGRWISTVLSPRSDARHPADYYTVLPDAGFSALGMPIESLEEQYYRDAVIGLDRRTARAPSGRYLYRIGPSGLAIIGLDRLRQIEDMVRSGGNLRHALCAQGLASLFTHARVRQRRCPA